MSIRDAQRPLEGATVQDVEVILGEDRDGRQVVSIRPSRILRSGVLNIREPGVLRDLIGELSTALAYLSNPYYRAAPPPPEVLP